MRRRAVLLLASWLLTAGGASAQADPDKVSLDEARALLERREAVVFDIREPKEQLRGVAPGMRLLPLSRMPSRLAEIPKDPTQPVLLICNTKNRSAKALATLKALGYTNARYVEGGMHDWAERGWPLQVPAAVIK